MESVKKEYKSVKKESKKESKKSKSVKKVTKKCQKKKSINVLKHAQKIVHTCFGG